MFLVGWAFNNETGRVEDTDTHPFLVFFCSSKSGNSDMWALVKATCLRRDEWCDEWSAVSCIYMLASCIQEAFFTQKLSSRK